MNNIIFPEFVSLYINENNKTCIYYFRGLDNDNNFIYQEFNEEQMPDHIKIINDDGSIIYEFKNKITSIKCHLISDFKDIKDKNIKIY